MPTVLPPCVSLPPVVVPPPVALPPPTDDTTKAALFGLDGVADGAVWLVATAGRLLVLDLAVVKVTDVANADVVGLAPIRVAPAPNTLRWRATTVDGGAGVIAPTGIGESSVQAPLNYSKPSAACKAWTALRR